MSSPTARTLDLLRREGYVAVVCEAFVPRVRRKRDLFGFADVAAVHPRVAGPLLVQVTTTAHLADRGRRVRSAPAARVWLQAGGRIELHGWERHGGRWAVRRVELHGEDLMPADLTPRPRRRGRRQRGLFDDLFRHGRGSDGLAPAARSRPAAREGTG